MLDAFEKVDNNTQDFQPLPEQMFLIVMTYRNLQSTKEIWQRMTSFQRLSMHGDAFANTTSEYHTVAMTQNFLILNSAIKTGTELLSDIATLIPFQ